MKASIQHKLQSLSDRLLELDRQLEDPNVVASMDNYRRITKEHAEISPVVALYSDYGKSEADVAAALDMAKDPEMRDFADEEIKASRARLEEIEIALQKALLPKDPNDEKNIFIEVRTRVTPSVRGGRSKSFPNPTGKWVVTRKSSRESLAKARIRA
jgi:peptide chain release factor 1